MKGLSPRGIFQFCLFAIIFAALFTAPSYADPIAHSFNVNDDIVPGTVVALAQADNTFVEVAPAANPSRVYGVVIDKNDASLTISQEDQTVFVATEGVYPVFVSREGGAIKAGDHLSISSTDGVATRASGRTNFIVGQATQDFNNPDLGKILVFVNPGKNPNLGESATVPAPLRRIIESVAGRPLSSSRIYSAMVIFLVTAGIAFSLLWVGVHSGMISIGRNPLSKHSIMQNLAQVIVAAVLVFIAGLLGIYLLLRI